MEQTKSIKFELFENQRWQPLRKQYTTKRTLFCKAPYWSNRSGVTEKTKTDCVLPAGYEWKQDDWQVSLSPTWVKNDDWSQDVDPKTIIEDVPEGWVYLIAKPDFFHAKYTTHEPDVKVRKLYRRRMWFREAVCHEDDDVYDKNSNSNMIDKKTSIEADTSSSVLLSRASMMFQNLSSSKIELKLQEMVVHSGYIHLQSNNKVFQNWLRRFCVLLTNECIAIFKNSDDFKSNKIPLQMIQLSSDNLIIEYTTIKAPKAYVLEISTGDKTNIHFSASKSDLEQWRMSIISLFSTQLGHEKIENMVSKNSTLLTASVYRHNPWAPEPRQCEEFFPSVFDISDKWLKTDLEQWKYIVLEELLLCSPTKEPMTVLNSGVLHIKILGCDMKNEGKKHYHMKMKHHSIKGLNGNKQGQTKTKTVIQEQPIFSDHDNNSIDIKVNNSDTEKVYFELRSTTMLRTNKIASYELNVRDIATHTSREYCSGHVETQKFIFLMKNMEHNSNNNNNNIRLVVQLSWNAFPGEEVGEFDSVKHWRILESIVRPQFKINGLTMGVFRQLSDIILQNNDNIDNKNDCLSNRIHLLESTNINQFNDVASYQNFCERQLLLLYSSICWYIFEHDQIHTKIYQNPFEKTEKLSVMQFVKVIETKIDEISDSFSSIINDSSEEEKMQNKVNLQTLLNELRQLTIYICEICNKEKFCFPRAVAIQLQEIAYTSCTRINDDDTTVQLHGNYEDIINMIICDNSHCFHFNSNVQYILFSKMLFNIIQNNNQCNPLEGEEYLFVLLFNVVSKIKFPLENDFYLQLALTCSIQMIETWITQFLDCPVNNVVLTLRIYYILLQQGNLSSPEARNQFCNVLSGIMVTQYQLFHTEHMKKSNTIPGENNEDIVNATSVVECIEDLLTNTDDNYVMVQDQNVFDADIDFHMIANVNDNDEEKQSTNDILLYWQGMEDDIVITVEYCDNIIKLLQESQQHELYDNFIICVATLAMSFNASVKDFMEMHLKNNFFIQKNLKEDFIDCMTSMVTIQKSFLQLNINNKSTLQGRLPNLHMVFAVPMKAFVQRQMMDVAQLVAKALDLDDWTAVGPSEGNYFSQSIQDLFLIIYRIADKLRNYLDKISPYCSMMMVYLAQGVQNVLTQYASNITKSITSIKKQESKMGFLKQAQNDFLIARRETEKLLKTRVCLRSLMIHDRNISLKKLKKQGGKLVENTWKLIHDDPKILLISPVLLFSPVFKPIQQSGLVDNFGFQPDERTAKTHKEIISKFSSTKDKEAAKAALTISSMATNSPIGPLNIAVHVGKFVLYSLSENRAQKKNLLDFDYGKLGEKQILSRALNDVKDKDALEHEEDGEAPTEEVISTVLKELDQRETCAKLSCLFQAITYISEFHEGLSEYCKEQEFQVSKLHGVINDDENNKNNNNNINDDDDDSFVETDDEKEDNNNNNDDDDDDDDFVTLSHEFEDIYQNKNHHEKASKTIKQYMIVDCDTMLEFSEEIITVLANHVVYVDLASHLQLLYLPSVLQETKADNGNTHMENVLTSLINSLQLLNDMLPEELCKRIYIPILEALTKAFGFVVKNRVESVFRGLSIDDKIQTKSKIIGHLSLIGECFQVHVHPHEIDHISENINNKIDLYCPY